MPLYNPTVGGAVESSEITDATIATDDIADGAVTMRKAHVFLREGGWLPTGAVTQTVLDRANSTNTSLTSGTLLLVGGCIIPGGVSVSSITFLAGGTSLASGSNQWFCLVDQSLNVLRKTSDDTSTAWAMNTSKTLSLSSSYAPDSATEVYVGIVVVAATPPTLRATQANAPATGLAPIFCGTSTASLTNPASLGSSAGSLTAMANPPVAYIS